MPLALLVRACVEGREATCRATSRVQHVHVHPAGLRKPFGAGRFIFEIQQCNRTQVVDVALARKLIDMGHDPDVRVIHIRDDGIASLCYPEHNQATQHSAGRGRHAVPDPIAHGVRRR